MFNAYISLTAVECGCLLYIHNGALLFSECRKIEKKYQPVFHPISSDYIENGGQILAAWQQVYIIICGSKTRQQKRGG